MNYEERYKKLRAAIVAMVGVEDEPGALLGMLIELNKHKDAMGEDAGAVIGVLVALIETGKGES